MDETIIKLVAQVLFAIAALIFVVYSIVAIYSLNTYGRTKTLTSAISIVYSAVVAGLLSWGLVFIMNIE
jgi:hypothetical protein